MIKLDLDELEVISKLANDRLFDLEDGETKHPKTDEGREAEAITLRRALHKISLREADPLIKLQDWELEQVETFATYIAQSAARATVVPEDSDKEDLLMDKMSYYFGKLEEIFTQGDKQCMNGHALFK